MHRLTRFSLDRPLLVGFLLPLVTAALASQIPRRGTQTGYRAYLGSDHPAVRKLDRFIDGFGGGLPIAAVWSCGDTDRCDSVFDDDALEMAATVAGRLEARDDVLRVESPATSKLLVVGDDTLGARSFLVDGRPAADRSRLAALAVRNPLWRGSLVSADATTGAIVVELTSSASDLVQEVVHALEGALAPFEAEGYRFHIIGQAAQFALTDESLASDSQRLTPIMVVLVATVVFLLFRSWQTVLASLVAVGLASLWTMGFQGALRWPENSITQTVPPLILVISLCVSLHLLSRYSQRRIVTGAVGRRERAAALVAAARDAGPACFAATATTAVGFLSFAASGLESFVRFGIVCGIGIAGSLILSFTILPILMQRLPPDRVRAARASETWDRALSAMVTGTRMRARSILLGAALLGVVCIGGVLRLETDVDEYKLYGEESSVVQAFRFVEAHLRRPDSLEIEIGLPSGRSIQDPTTLDALDAFATRVTAISGLGPARSVLDALKWTNRLLNEDDPAYDRLGQTPEENGSLLTVVSLDDPAALDHWISPDFRRVRFSVEAEKIPTSHRKPILEQVELARATALGPGWTMTLTGPFSVYYDMTLDIQRTQLSSFAIAAGVIFVILALFLRSLGGSALGAIGWALVGMFSTILPVVVTFGVMGFAGVNLDLGTAMVAAIIIGIGVDDTIHLLAEFTKRRQRGMSPDAAIESAVLRVGQAVLTTSVALSAGFFVLILSSWQSISSFGFLSGVAILGALAADLWLLPATILVFTSGGRRDREKSPNLSEKAPPRSRRVALSILALVPVLAILSAAALGLRDGSIQRSLACRMMPNGSIPLFSGRHAGCSLRPLDRILGVVGAEGVTYRSDRTDFEAALEKAGPVVTLQIERGRQTIREPVAMVASTHRERTVRFLLAMGLAGLLVGFALRVYWRSNAAAASALLFLFSAVSAELISILALPENPTWAAVGTPVTPLIAAALTHLALTYPRERSIVRVAPKLVALPYGLAAILAAVELRGLLQEPSFWALTVRFELFFVLGAATLLLLGAVSSARTAQTALDRARARLLLLASSGIGIALAGARLGGGEETPGGPIASLVVGVVLFVVPLGFALTRYDLFDWTMRARVAVDRTFRVATVAALAALSTYGLGRGTGLQGVFLWGLGAATGYMVASFLHRQLGGLVSRWLGLSVGRRRDLLLQQERRAAELATEEASARILGRTLEAGLDPTGVAIFLSDTTGWRPVYVGRENPALRLPFAAAAEGALGGSAFLHLARGDVPDSPEARLLRGAGVELVAAMRADRAALGLLLIGSPESGRAFTSEEIGFVRAAASHAGMAVHNARLAAIRIAIERRATFGRLVSGVAHDLGSPLRVIERRARRLAEGADDPSQVRHEAGKLEEISRYLLRTVYDMASDAERDVRDAAEGAALEDVIAQAINTIGLPAGQDRVLRSIAPAIPRLANAERLVRVISNLLTNALEASNPSQPIWVYATAQSGELRVEVRDEGRGMTPEALERAFDLFYTTRTHQGGSGVGLAISKEIVEDLGGKLELDSSPGSGTRATLRVPTGGGHP